MLRISRTRGDLHRSAVMVLAVFALNLCPSSVWSQIYTAESAIQLKRSVELLQAQNQALVDELLKNGIEIPTIPLSDAVEIFNSQAVLRNSDATKQRVLTEDEVLAAISVAMLKARAKALERLEEKKRNPVLSVETSTHREDRRNTLYIEELSEIIKTKAIPMNAKISLVTQIESSDGRKVDVWNVSLELPVDRENQRLVTEIRNTYLRIEAKRNVAPKFEPKLSITR